MKRVVTGIIIAVFAMAIVFIAKYRDKEMYVSVSDGVDIDFYSWTEGMKIEFEHSGVNDIYSIANIYYYDNLLFQALDYEASKLEAHSDWISPYMISVNDVDEDILWFTGGWHGSNGDKTGDSTALCKDVTILIDGNEIIKDYKGYCDRIEIIVVNDIQSYQDTSRYVLEETVSYVIGKDHSISVETTMEALEDISINRYYGPQVIIPKGFEAVVFENNEQEIERVTFDKLDGTSQVWQIVDTIMIEDIESNHYIMAQINTDNGLGSYYHKGEGIPYAFVIDYGKAYFNLVNEKALYIQQFDKVYWQGEYVFY